MVEAYKKKGVTYPLHSKINVNGMHCHPLFKFLKSSPNGKGYWGGESIGWSFTKFLIDANG